MTLTQINKKPPLRVREHRRKLYREFLRKRDRYKYLHRRRGRKNLVQVRSRLEFRQKSPLQEPRVVHISIARITTTCFYYLVKSLNIIHSRIALLVLAKQRSSRPTAVVGHISPRCYVSRYKFQSHRSPTDLVKDMYLVMTPPGFLHRTRVSRTTLQTRSCQEFYERSCGAPGGKSDHTKRRLRHWSRQVVAGLGI